MAPWALVSAGDASADAPPACATRRRVQPPAPLTGCCARGYAPCVQTYCQPVYELCDKTLGNILAPVWSLRNVVVRLVCRTIFICVCAFIGMMVTPRPCRNHPMAARITCH